MIIFFAVDNWILWGKFRLCSHISCSEPTAPGTTQIGILGLQNTTRIQMLIDNVSILVQQENAGSMAVQRFCVGLNSGYIGCTCILRLHDSFRSGSYSEFNSEPLANASQPTKEEIK